MTGDKAVRADAEQFWKLLRLAVLVSGVTASIAAVSKYTSEYSIEKAKQDAFMMKACVDAGGQWVKNYGPTWNCVRFATGERQE